MTDKNVVRDNAETPAESQPEIAADVLPQLDSTKITRTNERSEGTIAALFDGDNPFTIDVHTEPVPTEVADDGKPAKDAPPAPKFKPGEGNDLGGVDYENEPHSDAEYIRKELEAAGINPDELNVKIATYEPIYEHAKDHPVKVEEVINDDEHGISHDADVTTFSPKETTPEMKFEDHINADDPVADFVTDYAVAAMTDMTKFIQDEFLNQDEMRVLNVSQGFTVRDPYDHMMKEIQNDPAKYEALIKSMMGEEKGAELLKEMLEHQELMKRAEAGEHVLWPGGISELRGEFEQAMMDKVVATLKDNPEFNQAMEDYRDVTKQAADQGKFIVVAAGNEGMTERMRRLDIPDGNLYNWYAMSDHVISVGGYDNQGTPFDKSDDQFWDVSSEGTDQYQPDVLAQGTGIPTEHSTGGEKQGTSFAAPAVSVAIALMLEQNPDLTFEQVEQILHNSADPLEGVDEKKQGSGVLNIAEAIIAAEDSNKVAVVP